MRKEHSDGYEYIISDNGNYIIPLKYQHILYIRTTNDNPPYNYLKNIGPPVVGGYYPFTYKHELFNDCLQFAEGLTIGKHPYLGKKCQLMEKTSGLAFGFTDNQNIKITEKGNILNEFANPAIGESYAIVRQTIDNNKSPYHIAYVIFKDGTDNITIEADSGNQSLQKPIFDMYSTSDTTKSFHSRYIGQYGPNASTIVLTKKV